MKSWEVLERAIPRKSSEKVAQLLSVSADYVRRWRHEPESTDAPNSSGQRSILDRICDLIDVVFLVNPTGAGLIVDHINDHHRQLIETHALILTDQRECAREAAAVLKEATEAVSKLSVEGCDAGTIVELVELRNAAERAIASVRKTIRHENTLPE